MRKAGKDIEYKSKEISDNKKNIKITAGSKHQIQYSRNKVRQQYVCIRDKLSVKHLSHSFCSRRKYYNYFHTNMYVTNKCSWICVRIMKEKSLCSHPQRYLQFCPVALFRRTMHIFAINHLWNFEMLCFKNMITWNIVTITITTMNICCCLLPIYKCMDNFGTKIFWMLQFNTNLRTQELLVWILINIIILRLLSSTLLIVKLEILVPRCIRRFLCNDNTNYQYDYFYKHVNINSSSLI